MDLLYVAALVELIRPTHPTPPASPTWSFIIHDSECREKIVKPKLAWLMPDHKSGVGVVSRPPSRVAYDNENELAQRRVDYPAPAQVAQ